MEFNFELEHKQAMDRLKGLPPYLEKKVVKSGLQECGRYLRRDMQSRLDAYIGKGVKSKDELKRVTGILKKGIVSTSLRDKPGYPVMVLVGVTRKAASKVPGLTRRKKKGGGVASYWWFFHNGRRGQTGKPFVKEAADASKNRNISIMSQHISKGCNAYAAGGQA